MCDEVRVYHGTHVETRNEPVRIDSFPFTMGSIQCLYLWNHISAPSLCALYVSAFHSHNLIILSSSFYLGYSWEAQKIK